MYSNVFCVYSLVGVCEPGYIEIHSEYTLEYMKLFVSGILDCENMNCVKTDCLIPHKLHVGRCETYATLPNRRVSGYCTIVSKINSIVVDL